MAPIRRGALRWGPALGLALLVAACAVPRGFSIAAFDSVTEEIYTGTFHTIVGEPTAAVTLLGANTGVECQGVTGVDETDSIQVGDIGNLIVRCDDGRLIRGQIVYGADRAGFGAGRDSDENPYRFLFGRLAADEDELRAQFAVLIAEVPRDDEPLDTLFDEPTAEESAPADAGTEIADLGKAGDGALPDGDQQDEASLVEDVFGDGGQEDGNSLVEDVFGDGDQQDGTSLVEDVFGDGDQQDETAAVEDVFGNDEEGQQTSLLADTQENPTDEQIAEKKRRRRAATGDTTQQGADEDTLLAEDTGGEQATAAAAATENEPAAAPAGGAFDLSGFLSDDDISRTQE